MARPLIAPGMFDRLYNFYPSTVTVQEVAEAQSTSGALVPTWANKIGYVDLDCRLAPSGGKEVKRPDQTYEVSTHIVAITGWYAGIDEKNRAVVTVPGPPILTQTFDILLVENDGQDDSTRLVVELVK